MTIGVVHRMHLAQLPLLTFRTTPLIRPADIYCFLKLAHLDFLFSIITAIGFLSEAKHHPSHMAPDDCYSAPSTDFSMRVFFVIIDCLFLPFSYELGSGLAVILTKRPFNDGNWHTIEINRYLAFNLL